MHPTARAVLCLAGAGALAWVGVRSGTSEPLALALSLVGALLVGLACVASGRKQLTRAHGSASWVRLTRSGTAAESLEGVERPLRRGVWRRLEASWRSDCLGFWRIPNTAGGEHELVVPPEPMASPICREPLGGLPASAQQAENEIAHVRRYQPGDPLRQIAWRTSAHHGRLMSYDLRGSETRAVVLVADTLCSANADALASATWQLAAELSRQERVIVTDGVETAAAADDSRMLALLEAPVAEPGAAERAGEVERLARSLSSQGTWRLVLVTDARNGALEQALRTSRLGHACEVVRTSEERHREDAKAGQTSNAPLRAPWWPRLLAAVCCLMCWALTLSALTSLVSPGVWSTLAGALLAAATLAATLRADARSRHRAAGRALAGAALCLAAGVGAALAAMAQAGALSILGAADPLDILPLGASLLVTYARDGFAQLWEQWVPLAVGSPVTEVVCLLTAGTLVAALRLVMASRRLRPLVATVPLALYAVRTVYLAEPTPAPCMAAVCACCLVLIGLAGEAHSAADIAGTNPVRTPMAGVRRGSATRARQQVQALRAAARQHAVPRLAVPALTVALSCVAALALATPLSAAVQGLGFSARRGFLAGNSVNPLVDLSRQLATNSSDAAFTYETTYGSPLYLRLASIDELSTDTWALSTDATDAEALPGNFDDGSPLADASSPSAEGYVYKTRTTVTLRGLSSRYAPAPTNARSSTAAANTPASWHWTPDGALISSSAGTTPAMSYAVEGLYLPPITSATQAEQALLRLPDSYASAADSPVQNLSRYLTLPDTLPASVQQLAQQMQAEVGKPPEYGTDESTGTTQYQLYAMMQLLAYFKDEGFTYSLNAPADGNNLEVLGEFLTTKSGYCTHYASALAVLGRALGIPTRMAIGYSGALRASDGSYVATNQYLHAWCEAYIAGVGWVSYDATPGADSGSFAGGTQASQTSNATTTSPATTDDDAADTNATDDAEADDEDSPASDATTAVNAAAEGTESGRTVPPAWLTAAGAALRRTAPGLVVIAAGALALTAPALARRLRWRRRKRAILAGEHPYSAAWDELCSRARRAGVALPPTATELDQAALIAQAIRDAGAGAAEQSVSAAAATGQHGSKPAMPSTATAGAAELREQESEALHALARSVSAERYNPEPPACNPTELLATLAALTRALPRNRPGRQ